MSLKPYKLATGLILRQPYKFDILAAETAQDLLEYTGPACIMLN